MNISNTRVSTRLSVGFALVLVLLGVITALGIYHISQTQQRLDKVLTVNNVQSRLAATMRTAVLDRTIALRNIAAVSDPAELEQEVERFHEQERQYRSAEEQLTQMLSEDAANSENRALLDKIRQAAQAAQPLLQKALQLGQAQQTAEANCVLMAEVRPVQSQWLASLDELSRAVDKQSIMYGFESAREYESTRNLMLALGAAALLVGIAAAALITRSLVRQLGGQPNQAVQITERIAAGDLTVAIDTRPGDQTSLLHALKEMRDSLASMVIQVRTGTDSIASASAQIASGNMDLSSRTEEQASSLEETASSMEELTSTVKQNADNARQANSLAQSASDVASQGGAVVSQVVETMGSINASSKKIVDIISVIDGIAFQTNILALNAAVEAARAGEQGRGFAVVAAEVRTLAQRSAAAAKEIKELIGDSVEKVDAGARLVDQAGTTMEEIVTSIRRVTDIMGEITAASQEQTAGIEQINMAITQMDDVTQQNAALVEQSAAAAQSMQSQAGKLAQVVGVFKVNGTAARGLVAQKAAKPAATARAARAPAAPASGALTKPASPAVSAAARLPEPERKLALARAKETTTGKSFRKVQATARHGSCRAARAGNLLPTGATLGIEPADESRHQRQYDDAHQDRGEVLLDPGDIAEQVTGYRQRDHPDHCARDVVERETAVRHLRDAGHKRRQRAHDRNEAGDDDGLAAMPLEKFVGDPQVFRVRPPILFALERLAPEPATHGEIDSIAGDGGDEHQHDHQRQAQTAGGCQRAGHEQEGVAGQEGHHHQAGLDEYDQKQEGVYPRAIILQEFQQMYVDVQNQTDKSFDHPECLG